MHKGPLEPGVVEEPCGETEVPVQVEPAQYGSEFEARAVLERRLTAQPPLSRACRVVPARQVAGLQTSITATAGGMAGLQTSIAATTGGVVLSLGWKLVGWTHLHGIRNHGCYV